MNLFLQILQKALVENLNHRKSNVVRRSVIGITIIYLMAVLSFVILLFLALAFYNWTLLYTAPPLAALATAGAALLLCLIIAFTAFLMRGSKPKSTQSAQSTDEASEMIAAVTSMAHKELNQSVDKNPKTTLLVAVLAGLLAGKYLN